MAVVPNELDPFAIEEDDLPPATAQGMGEEEVKGGAFAGAGFAGAGAAGAGSAAGVLEAT